MRSVVAVVASYNLLRNSDSASAASFSLSLLVLSIAAHSLFATALCADSFATAVILAADDCTTNMIGRIFAAFFDLAFSSSRSFFSSYVCLDLLLNNHLSCRLRSWFGSRLGSWLRSRLSLLHHHRLLHHHTRLLLRHANWHHHHARLLHLRAWLLLSIARLLHHHRLHHHHARLLLDHARLNHHAWLHLNHARLSGHLHRASLHHSRLRRLSANQHRLWLGRGLIRGGNLGVRFD